jgi:glycosyltransferase involved in cell wall biosynthesis
VLFSVIIPTYNRRAFLDKALQSVLAQRMADYEVTVVDDGSDDDTPIFLSRLGSTVRVFSDVNQGPGAARNLGAYHATGDYLAFLDSDDLLFPWSLSVYKKVIEQAGRPAFIAGRPFAFERE